MSWSAPGDRHRSYEAEPKGRSPVRSTTIHAPGQERVKGNELGGAFHGVRPPDEWEKGVDHRSQEVCKGVVGRLSGAKRPASSDSDA